MRCMKQNTKTKRGYCSLLESSTLLLERSKKEEITRYRSKGEKYVIDSKVINFVRPVIVPLRFPLATRCFRFRKLLLEEEEKKRFSRRSLSSPFFCQRGGISIKIRPRQLRRFLCHLVCYKFSQPLVDRCRRRRVKASS